ncbi:MAG: hypothetical protein IKB72_04550 [Ruminococcus sp.]|nr:hypothetical protein [Ruminococcus sp.]
MASKNKSEKLGLNLWNESDRPQRADFNSDNMILDEAIGSHLENEDLHLTAEEKARVFSPLTSAVYVGNGTASRTITLPCRAQALMVYCVSMPCAVFDSQQGCTKVYSAFYANGAGAQAGVSVSGTTLNVTQQTGAENGFVCCLNESGKQYRVAVLR